MIYFILLVSFNLQILIKHLLSTGQKDKWDTELIQIADFLSYISTKSSKNIVLLT